MKKLLSLILIVILSAGFFHSCKKDKGDPPTLPPAESMKIDFSNFLSQKKSAGPESFPKGTENSNWEFASGVALFWNSILTTTLVVPVATFAHAVDQDPVYLDDKTWQWSFSVSVSTVTYKARLTGQIRDTDVLWKMYVSGSFAEFVWFEGTSKLDGTGGQWILNESSTAQSPYLKIDWTKTSSSIGSIKYTYMKNDSYVNSYIEYGLTTGTLNAYYNVHYFNGLIFSDVDIEWNTTTHNGRVSCSNYLLGEWYCWNEQKINIICD